MIVPTEGPGRLYLHEELATGTFDDGATFRVVISMPGARVIVQVTAGLKARRDYVVTLDQIVEAVHELRATNDKGGDDADND